MRKEVLFGCLISCSLISTPILGFNSPKSDYKDSIFLTQFGNSISGFVFGYQRQPISEVTVELLDDYSRSVGRIRTDASGRYAFNRISRGRFRVRVIPLGTDYQEQEQEVEIINITNQDSAGRATISGSDNVQKDFYLRLRKSVQSTSRTESVFVQEIPVKAKETYKKAIQLLDNKKDEQGLKDLKSAIEIFPDYYEALERLGTEYIKLQHFVPAQILLQKAVQVNPRGYKSWYGFAYALYSLNILDEAIEAAQKASSLNQFSVDAPLLSGVLLRKAKRYDEAEKQLKKANDLSKGSLPDVHWHLALLYGNNLNRYNEAANELKEFLKVSPNAKNVESIKKLIKQFEDKSQEKSHRYKN